jgi:hypothetical protein
VIALLLLLQTGVPGPVAAARVDPLLARTPVPREGAVAVQTAASADAIYLGDQLEVLTSAWFPAVVRQRLRRPPVLRPPSLSGVYGLPVLTLPGVSAIRTVGGTTYDIFASYQVVFPVTTGRLEIPAAELGFTLPGGRLFFADDQAEERRSLVRAVEVRPLPPAGQPEGFSGAVARDLRIAWRIGSPTVRAGEVLEADLYLSGTGNLALWPAPGVGWPADLRVYPDRVNETPEWRGGRLGGVRRIRYLVLPDSVGSVTLPAVRYSFFDPGAGRYREAAAAPVVVPVLPPARAGRVRQAPPWAPERPAALPHRLAQDLAPALWLLVVLAPGASLLIRSRRGRAPARAGHIAGGAERFERALVALAGPQQAWDSASLAAHLRRAGVQREEAETAVAIHVRLRRSRFAAHGATDTEAIRLGATWVDRLPSRLRRAAGLVVVLCCLGSPLLALARQAPSPEALYREGAWDAAARAQGDVVRANPGAATAWQNLASARWAAGQDGPAAAALLEAYRLAPRNQEVRRLWASMSMEHQQLRSLAPVLPVTAPELLLAALGAWLLAWTMYGLRRERWAVVFGVLAVLPAAAGFWLGAADSRSEALTNHPAVMRLSPHGLAPQVGTVDGFALVPVGERRPGWVRIRDPFGRPGWVEAPAVTMIRGLD